MADPYLSIVSAGGSLQSNEIAVGGVGVEVEAGMTGLGLPPVELQFDQSAGDGARFRGRRVQQRSLDLSVNVYGPTRTSLKGHIDRLAKILAHECTVTWHDPDANEAWYVVGWRSGGGDYAYGKDSNGNTEATLGFSVLTGNPFWQAVARKSTTVTNSGTASVAFANTGTMPSPPIWTVKGPTLGFTATSPSGEKIRLYGLIDKDATLTINCEDGTVKDNYGFSRYNFLADMPRFWHVPSGNSTATITLDATTAGYGDAYVAPRRNHIVNPAFTTDASNWTLNGYVYSAANQRIQQNVTKLTARPSALAVVTGLVVGENYVVSLGGTHTPGNYGANAIKKFAQIQVIDGSVTKRKQLPEPFVGGRELFEFTAENTSASIKFLPETALSGQDLYQRSIGVLDSVYVGPAGPYFDGSTPDTAIMDYAWSGAANASQSTANPIPTPAMAGTPQVTVSYAPRKDMVI